MRWPPASSATRAIATPDADGCILRYARAEDVGAVHRVIVTIGNDGYVLAGHASYNLSTGAPMRTDALLRRFSTATESVLACRTQPGTVRIRRP